MYIPDINFLVTCIWGYMGCAKQGKKPDKDCKEDFNGCSMIAMGMAPPSTTTERSVNKLGSVLIKIVVNKMCV